MHASRRWLLISGLGSFAVVATGCMTKPLRPANADGTYCHRAGRAYRPTWTCTPSAIPTLAAEEQAKRFTPDAAALTIYLVRKRWTDGLFPVRVATDGMSPADLVPETFARWRLRPGRHRLTLAWPDGTTELEVSGSADEVLFVEVIGSAWAWGSTFRLEVGDTTDSRDRAGKLRLVADPA